MPILLRHIPARVCRVGRRASADGSGMDATLLALIVAPDGRRDVRGSQALARYHTDPAKPAARLAFEVLIEARRDERRLTAGREDTLLHGCALPSDRLAS